MIHQVITAHLCCTMHCAASWVCKFLPQEVPSLTKVSDVNRQPLESDKCFILAIVWHPGEIATPSGIEGKERG